MGQAIMFNFTHVLNATTGEMYYIDKAILNDNGDGYRKEVSV